MMGRMSIDPGAKRIADGLRDCTLPYPEWTHRAHWTAALVFTLEEDSPDEAISAAIFQYNDRVGTPNSDDDGFHTTITSSSMIMAAKLVAESDAATVSEAVDGVMAGPLGGMAWLERHYSAQTLWSRKARKAFVAPDREPLPNS